LNEDLLRQAELKRMKFVATGLLGVALIIFVLASMLEERTIWAGFVRAAAEAAMVGGIADWFAVTALFRHPLGLKIPHTAIIPRRKDALGRRLGRFVKNNFLSGPVITERLRATEVTRRVAEWISQPENSELIADQVAIGIAAVVQVMRDEDIQELIEHNAAAQIQSTQFAPLLGNLLSLILSGNRQYELLSGSLKLGSRFLKENKTIIKKRIAEETPWWLPRTVDEAIYRKIVDGVDETLRQVSRDPKHPLHQDFMAVVDQFVDDLKHSPDVLSKEQAFKENLLQDAVVQEFSYSVWVDIKTALIDNSTNPNPAVHQSIQQGLVRLGQTLLSDEAMLEKINHWVERSTLYLVEKYGYEVEFLIANTISKWDAEATSQKVELQVGRDLQFIRINGTVVGGLVGLVIYTISFFVGSI
jgi:uncharacterized membrane-anchored protein YjiN (DUF445 family)